MSGGPEKLKGRVLRTVGGVYEVEVAGETLECALRGRLKRKRGIGRVAVGDEVEVDRLTDGSCVISELLPRSSRLSRRSADGRREQIIAANVDRLAAVFSVARPEPGFELLDRFLVLAESCEIAAFIVVNKIDLAGADEVRERFALYKEIGYPVLYTSAKAPRGLEELGGRLAGHITLFVGPSGAGKSSLLNALQPGLGLRVGEISKAIERGRHTTVAAWLHRLDAGGYVLDTPGLGKVRFWEVGTHKLAWCFREFRPYLGRCRFQDCSHTHEPGCAVIGAKEAGSFSSRRYESYVKFLGESLERSS
ncbi:MAG: ribosome small subunit-dependent GTPase A [Gemmatimonadota bacterium]|nr:MAG: ribosome small subunit-dependent GTPase A [Gemmatimonadota bacterium]